MLSSIVFPEPVFHLWDSEVSVFNKESFFILCRMLSNINFSPVREVNKRDPFFFKTQIAITNPTSAWIELFKLLKDTSINWMGRDTPLLRSAKVVDKCAELNLPRIFDVKLFSSRHIPIEGDEEFAQFYLDFVKMSPTIAYVYRFGQATIIRERIFPSPSLCEAPIVKEPRVRQKDPFTAMFLLRKQLEEIFQSCNWNWDGSDMMQYAFQVRRVWDCQLSLENTLMTFLRDVRVRKIKRQPPLSVKKLCCLISAIDDVRLSCPRKRREQILQDLYECYHSPDAVDITTGLIEEGDEGQQMSLPLHT